VVRQVFDNLQQRMLPMTISHRRFLTGLLVAAAYVAISYGLMGSALRAYLRNEVAEDVVFNYVLAGPISFLLQVSSLGATGKEAFFIAYVLASALAAASLWVLLVQLKRPTLIIRGVLALLIWLGLGFVGFVATSVS
jgi:hypothetical protein